MVDAEGASFEVPIKALYDMVVAQASSGSMP